VTLDGSIPGTPADKAGLGAGDVITQFDGTVVNTLDELKALVQAHEPGDVVSVTYTDAGGASQTAQLTLTEGPA
jgi:S1-C subfamily serine protease